MLREWEQTEVRAALATNETDRRERIVGCFTWCRTPKGHDWWSAYHFNKPNSPTDAEACAELRDMLGEGGTPEASSTDRRARF